MNKLSHKLGSRSGESMVLALVFLLFCTLVGSSVLVSATANAGRLRSTSDLQSGISQRSAAHLMADELRAEAGEQLALYVSDSAETNEETGETWRTITFQIATNMESLTPMQQLLLETAVWRYLQENPREDAEILLQGFHWAEGTGDFRCRRTEGNLTLGGTAEISGRSVTLLEETELSFSCGAGDGAYDFAVIFPGMKLTLSAVSGTGEPVCYTAAPVTTETVRTVITWERPRIEKGDGE